MHISQMSGAIGADLQRPMMTAVNPLLLLVDDDRQVLGVISRFAADAGFDVIGCAGGRAALDQLPRQPALALIDLRMPDMDGLELLRMVRSRVPACSVVLMTGYGTIDTAIEAVKLGATDYLSKPLDFARLRRLLADVKDEDARRRSVLAVESEMARRLEFCGMLGRSAAMQQVFSLIRRLAPHVRNALITGETGTGKELAARAFHRLGPRATQQFVPVNCSAVVETLSESELFGHVRGAFTGASDHKAGMFELANGGTLFLDEIGELPLSIQAKLLRALETGEIQRVGSPERRHVDVHVFAATNRDLRAEVASGRFRNDLLYRLNVIELKLPPLREHREDIPYLAAAFVREFSERMKKPLGGITTEAEGVLVSGRWDGNVRELRNVIERACILAESELISEREVAGVELGDAGQPPVPAATPVGQLPVEDEPQSLLSSVERDHIVRVLERTNGNKKAAAQALGISRRRLYRHLERYQLHTPAKSQPVCPGSR
jgi:two-component system, NtrC family, response regulator HydG